MVRALAGLAVLAAVLVLVFSGREGEAQPLETCGFEPFEFDTHEVNDNAGLYLAAIELAAAGEAVTSPTTPSGEPHGLEYPGLLRGSQQERTGQMPNPSLRIPPTLLKSIVWVESGFHQAPMAIPYGGVGQVLRSFDCGFGLGQITSGMANETGNPSARQALVGTHFLFNVAEAARMLAEKWNGDFPPIAGDGDPALLEDWYYAVWGYNGFVFENHPQNPYLNPLRGEVWHCNDRSSPSWKSEDGVYPELGYIDYTYPERVYGCMRHPPAYPERLASDPAYAPTPWPEVTPEPQPTGTPTPNEGDSEGEDPSGEETPEAAAPRLAAGGDPWPAPGPDGIVRLWPPVQVNMPDLEIPAVKVAFSPQVYFACVDAGWFPGCPEMHFPTSFPDLGIEPHRDPTPPVDPTLRDRLIGAPDTLIKGPSSIAIAVDESGQPDSVEVTVQNVGTWIAPFRIQTSAPWVVVHREGNGRLHGGVAIGAETTVWECRPGPTAWCTEDVTKRGHTLALIITIDVDQLPEGEDVQGTVTIEPLLGEGAVKVIDVHAGPSVETTTALEAHEDEAEQALKHRIVVPNVTKDD